MKKQQRREKNRGEAKASSLSLPGEEGLKVNPSRSDLAGISFISFPERKKKKIKPHRKLLQIPFLRNFFSFFLSSNLRRHSFRHAFRFRADRIGSDDGTFCQTCQLKILFFLRKRFHFLLNLVVFLVLRVLLLLLLTLHSFELFLCKRVPHTSPIRTDDVSMTKDYVIIEGTCKGPAERPERGVKISESPKKEKGRRKLLFRLTKFPNLGKIF